MPHTPQQRRGGAAFALAMLAIGLAIVLACRSCEGAEACQAEAREVTLWTRQLSYVTTGVLCEPSYAATLCFPEAWDDDYDDGLIITGQELWFVQQELRAMNKWRAHTWIYAGDRFRAPLYRRWRTPMIASIGFTMRQWHRVAVRGGYCWPSSTTRWTRAATWYEVKHTGQSLASVAHYLLPEGNPQETWLYAQELAAIRGVPAATIIPKGTRLRVSVYKPYHGPASRYHTVGIRTWHVAVLAGMRFRVRPSALVGIRLHEGGNRLSPRSPWGCKPHGGYTFRGEAMKAAEIVRRHANRKGWDSWKPTRTDLDRLGGYYTKGDWGAVNTGWGACISAIMQRAEG